MKNLYTYEDLQNSDLKEQSFKDTEEFYSQLEEEQDGKTNTGFSSFDEAIQSIIAPSPFTQAQANTFFSI